MDKDLYSFALTTTLSEIQTICPDIKNAFMFTEDGQITTQDTTTPQKAIVRAIDTLEGILEKAETLNGIKLVTIEGDRGKANVSRTNNHYLVTVTSQDADENVNITTHTIITTVLKILDKISPAPLKWG